MGTGIRVFVIGMAAVAVAFSAASVTNPATARRQVLHIGSRGKPVKNLQWLLKGHRPSHYRRFKPYKGRINGKFRKSTGKAVRRMKYRIGYPKKLLNMQAGPYFVDILLGKHKRPVSYLAREVRRTRYIHLHPPKLSVCQQRIVRIANSQVGIREVPMGSNSGYFVHIYQSATGAYNAPWCASFAQWVLKKAGKGPIANRSASVFYIQWWARSRGLLRGVPKVGTLALFLESAGHMGIVTAVGKTGFTTVDGNWSDQVSRVFHPYYRSNVVFVYLPQCAR